LIQTPIERLFSPLLIALIDLQILMIEAYHTYAVLCAGSQGPKGGARKRPAAAIPLPLGWTQEVCACHKPPNMFKSTTYEVHLEFFSTMLNFF